jgi:hypothetical protein
MLIDAGWRTDVTQRCAIYGWLSPTRLTPCIILV